MFHSFLLIKKEIELLNTLGNKMNKTTKYSMAQDTICAIDITVFAFEFTPSKTKGIMKRLATKVGRNECHCFAIENLYLIFNIEIASSVVNRLAITVVHINHSYDTFPNVNFNKMSNVNIAN